ncbi:FadR family transcriptional regulator [Rhizobium sp. KVB221]|uniref:Pyruvate dehydrogenase complex repressor n=1 Tax=Rhizobium setariae TaxID=2801340 RepID=A0A936YI26_9HYPH|nr:FadR/GntR family transcriptional regulator [Rhizobium setariae]MBL0370555.1 FadR family transcriptional regulator [Rhizobium setariae]
MGDELFQGIDHMRTADEAVRQIELLLLDGVLSSGDRLPSERDLAEQLDISRPVLREALKELENRQLIVSRHGGGTYVADLIGQVFSKPVAQLVSRHDRATRDYLEYRRELEGHASELAAQRATPADRERLSSIFAKMKELHERGDPEGELDADVELHNAIGEAAHNLILMHTLRACYRLLSEGIFHHRKLILNMPEARETLLAQHAAIVVAIVSGDAQAARNTAERHIDYVAATAAEAALSLEREKIANLRKVQRETSKSAPADDKSTKGRRI